MIEINAWHLTALILAVVLFTSLIWLGVAVILAGRDKTAEAMKAATEEMRAAATLMVMTDADRCEVCERVAEFGGAE